MSRATNPIDHPLTCPGCGGRNPNGASECDWCGRPFVSHARRMRLTAWQLLSSVLLVGVVGAVAALAFLNAGRALPPVRASAGSPTAGATVQPTLAVTPRLTTPATATPEPPRTPTEPPPEPTPAATPTPQLQVARIANTGGLGVTVRAQPGPQAARAGVLRDGTQVRLTGNDQTIAARVWREIETEDRGIKGWVQADFLTP